MVRAAQKADGLGSASTDRTQYDELMVGLDVGSTTVKAVVMDPRNDEILWKDYERHETRQPEKVLDFLNRIEADFPLPTDRFRIFITGSGGKILEDYIGAKLVQEVNAVSLAVEHLYPEAGSVIELGGQDAKIIIWLTDEETGTKRKVPSMNDKCAGGTGAVIDKIAYKLQLEGENLRSLPYFDVKLHPVAGKCGVFAETDINGLQKQGIPPDQLMASLYEAIVQQNLSVLTRGNTLRPTVLLLGGPNTFIPALRDCWKENIPKIWKERNVPLPESVDPADLVMTPDNAQYYAAIGAVLYGKGEDPDVGAYKGTDALTGFIEVGRTKMREASGDVGLWRTEEELEEFKQLFAKKPWEPATFSPGQEVEAFVGIDGGSTSTKGVLMDRGGNVLAAAYQLSKGNPLSDTQDILADLRESVESQGAVLNVAGVGTTGYAKDMLKDTLAADVAIVETVAHTKSALHYYPDADVIVDVGGQDIKVIVLNNGKVKDFKLNTQCSAGNGYFLQNTASKFGYSVAEFADVAFSAEKIPVFGYGCAVFMETDIVNFQQLGWEKKEIMAGLAKVLPKNIWLYVVAEPNLRKFGTKFILQGGTQHNLAAVKSQYDFIKSKVPESTIRVHKFTGESGAIGAALEATRVAAERDSSFIGIAAAQTLEFTSTRDESTRCSFCKNTCLRTFVDTKTSDGETNRFIIATCEKGQVEKVEDVKAIKSRMDEVSKANPNFVEKAALAAFRSTAPPKVSTLQEETGQEPAAKTKGLLSIMRWRKAPAATRAAPEVVEQRASIKIGMPRALNMYSLAPFFSAYFHALGVGSRNVIYSDYTNPEMWFKGSRRGSIDQCFPSKVAIAHVHNLIFDQKVKPDVIFFPIIQNMRTELVNTVDNTACPVVSITPEVIKAAYTQEGNIFAQNGIQYIAPAYDMANWPLFEHQIFESFRDILSLTSEENSEAVEIALASWRKFYEVTLRAEARQVLDSLEEHGKVGVVMLGRPYHNDPGLNHEIMIDMQRRGYPIFSIDSLPQDEDILDRLFGEDIRSGLITHAMDITDVWKNNYSENSSKKIWAAKYVARHPNLVAIDLSSFKCGHDAPIYNTVERIIEASETPYFTFHDVDENKPTGSIKIRVETVDYFLKRYQEYLQSRRNDEVELEQLVEQYRAHLEAQSERNASRAEVRAAGNVSFTGNGADNHVGHDHNGNNGHDEAEWVSLPAPSGLNGHNGNGCSPEHSLENGAAIAPNGNGQSRDHAAYDRIRALNTSGDAPEDDPASASLSCNLPTRDFAPKVYQHLDHEENSAEDAPPGIPDHQWMTMQIMTPRAKKGDNKVGGRA
ncbi:MAG: BadF/BadG/BcrA/BcrD ATPase family protein [SAR202 cluster bacterium]|nr:BadF/BadG/BcrA/BcrD ATPase family protein [SAR202 cluster bacterium]